MGRRGEHTKEELATMALDAAIALLEEEGEERLTTRAVAQRIGYTVGSLYFLFRNRDDLLLQVNERTLDELRAAIDAALLDCSDPRAGLFRMGHEYFAFAAAHPARWRLVFELQRAEGSEVPEGLTDKIEGLFALVGEMISRLVPTLDSSRVRRAAQSLWSGVHGIAMLAITRKLAAGGDVDAQILTEDLIGHYLSGLAAESAAR